MRSSSVFVGVWLFAGTVLGLQTAQAQDASADYEARIQRLEEQIVDLSAQLGTVETMAQGGGGMSAPAPSAGFSGGGGGGPVEDQVQALSAQLGEVMRRLQRIEQRFGGLAPSEQPQQQGGLDRPSRQAAGSPFGADRDPEPEEDQGTGFSIGGDDRRPEPGTGGFGTTIEAGPGGNPRAGSAAPQAQGGGTGAVQTAASSSPQARAAYDQAYNALVQRNYRAATSGFEGFVQSHPADPLAGSAYYWLGEASFISGEYRQAADAFLKSSTNYPQNDKAAEALLKLGIALKRLGENQAACSSFAELARRFPSATPVLQRAERERSRTQC